MESRFSLKGKVAVIAGGNGGIGKEIARAFAGMGAYIVIAARDVQKTADAVRKIREALGVNVLGLKIGVTDAVQNQLILSPGKLRFQENQALEC